MILHCSQRALRDLGIDKALVRKDIMPTTEDSWYAHTFFIGRKKHLIVTHAKSLFSSVQEGFKKADAKDIGKLLKTMVSRTLFLEQHPDEVIRKASDLMTDIQYARSSDRSIIGSMNDLIGAYKYYRDDRYDCFRDFKIVMYDLNRTPLKPIRGKYAMEIFMRMLGYPDYKTSFRGAAS